MVVENKWFAGVISIPLYVVTFLSLSLVIQSVFVYIILGMLVLYLAGILYQSLVVNRAKKGVSQSVVTMQWLVAQLLITGVLYAAMSLSDIKP